MTDTYSTRSLRELARILCTRFVGILVILVLVVAGVVAFSLMSSWQYRSSSLLMARPAAPLTDIEGRASMRDRISLFVVTQRELITSDYVITTALMRLDGIKPDAASETGEATGYYKDDTVRDFAAANVKRVSRARSAITVETPGGPDVTFTQTFNVLVTWPEERDLADERDCDARELATQRAQTFLGHLLDAYLARREGIETRYARQSSEFLVNKATAAARKNLDAAGEAMETFIREELKGDLVLVQNMLGGVSEMGPQSLRTSFESQIRTRRARLAQIAAIEETVKTAPVAPSGMVAVPPAVANANPAIARLQDAVVKLQLKINQLTPRYDPSYRQLKELQRERDADLATLKQELSRQLMILTQEKAILQGELASMEAFVEADKKQIEALSLMATRYKGLRDGLDNAQEIYNKRMAEAIASQSAEALASSPMEVAVMDAPSLPDPSRPHRPILWLNVLVGILTAVILALIYAFVADHLDHTVKGNEDIERYVGTTVLASVPKYWRKIIRA